MVKHENVLRHIEGILSKIPDDTGLTELEVLLEVAAVIVEEFPKGVHRDVDKDLEDAFNLITEAAAYYGGVVHGD